jgi:vacuolar protein sorting-associated protein 26
MLRQDKPQAKEQKESGGFFSKLIKRVEGCDITFEFKGRKDEDRVTVDDPYEKVSERLHLFRGDEEVVGVVQLKPKGQFKHQGITLELVGTITTLGEREERIDFLKQEKRFDTDLTLSQNVSLDFSFTTPKDYESYRGQKARVGYYLRININRQVKNIREREELWVSRVDPKFESLPDASLHRNYFRETAFGKDSVSMEVGVDNILHIEFKYDKKMFHLQERVLGMVTFKVADLDLQYGEVGIVRKEYINPGKANEVMEAETLQKFEVMDGTPIPGEVVPIRMYLNSIGRLTPSYDNVHNVFRVAYFVNLVLVTGEGKRYFKSQEIFLYRKKGQEAPVPML